MEAGWMFQHLHQFHTYRLQVKIAPTMAKEVDTLPMRDCFHLIVFLYAVIALRKKIYPQIQVKQTKCKAYHLLSAFLKMMIAQQDLIHRRTLLVLGTFLLMLKWLTVFQVYLFAIILDILRQRERLMGQAKEAEVPGLNMKRVC